MTTTWAHDLLEGRITPPPAAVLLGFDLRAFDPGARTIEIGFTARAEFLNLAGHVQGGLLCAMLDSVLGSVVVATLDEGEWAPTTDLHTQFHSPGLAGPIVGHGRVTRRGRRIAFASGELVAPDGRLIATAVATSAITSSKPTT
ncbi:PaaI family thioesterase [Nocardioides sp.]|uniref:PaaI family thioesterase n=1 Tax=Nocardioides sp. TaxID=35761 RepID=UPI002B26C09F|nr:PaaI family thioesterase [Nocardioides sp.]